MWKLLSDHWEAHKDKQKNEIWPAGNIYTNHWAAPTYMVSVEDDSLENAGQTLKSAIWEAAKSTIEHWTGMEQKPTSMYGIRVYTEGAILNPHVDRLPLVGSCIINVDQDVDEPWVLEVYDRHDRAVNVTMEVRCALALSHPAGYPFVLDWLLTRVPVVCLLACLYIFSLVTWCCMNLDR